MKKFYCLLALLSIVTFTGCPDYSHLNEVPDYENMSDSSSSESQEEFPEE